MIMDALIAFWVGIIHAVNEVIPDWAFMEATKTPVWLPVSNGGTWIYTPGNIWGQVWSWVAGFNHMFPIAECVELVGWTIALYGTMAAIVGGKWLIGVVRGAGTR